MGGIEHDLNPITTYLCTNNRFIVLPPLNGRIQKEIWLNET